MCLFLESQRRVACRVVGAGRGRGHRHAGSRSSDGKGSQGVFAALRPCGSVSQVGLPRPRIRRQWIRRERGGFLQLSGRHPCYRAVGAGPASCAGRRLGGGLVRRRLGLCAVARAQSPFRAAVLEAAFPTLPEFWRHYPVPYAALRMTQILWPSLEDGYRPESEAPRVVGRPAVLLINGDQDKSRRRNTGSVCCVYLVTRTVPSCAWCRALTTLMPTATRPRLTRGVWFRSSTRHCGEYQEFKPALSRALRDETAQAYFSHR